MTYLQCVVRAMLGVVNTELIEVQGNSAICRGGDRDPAACESVMRDSSLLARVIPITSCRAVLQFEALVAAGCRCKGHLELVTVAAREYSI